MFFSREVDSVRWFPVAFLANSAFIVIHAGFEPTTPVLRVHTFYQYYLSVWGYKKIVTIIIGVGNGCV